MSLPAHRTKIDPNPGYVRCARSPGTVGRCPDSRNIHRLYNQPHQHETKRIHPWRAFLLSIVFLFIIISLISHPASAASGDRFLYTPQSGSVHVWTLKAWKDNAELCEIYRADEKQPTGTDIRAYCGEKVYTQWATSAPCTSFIESGKTTDCTGAYLTYQGNFFRNYNSYTTLPKSSASISLENCDFGEWCSEKPLMIFTGVEPLTEYEIVEVHVIMGDQSYDCYNASACDMNIPLTTNMGVWAEYWVVSSLGDESEHLTVHIRNLYRGQNSGQYLVDILSPDIELAGVEDFASAAWDIFPEMAHPNEPLYVIPENVSNLGTDLHLYYLAGKLIFTGKVDASECVQNGLLDNSNANTCGEEKTYLTGLDSQNAYDQQLLNAGIKYAIPPRLVKAIITQETQFWPEPGIQYEYGLGCLTENGVDVLLNWDTETFLNLCTSQYSEDKCSSGYANMTAVQQAVVRGLALRPVGTDQEIDLITHVVQANVIQVDQTIRAYTGDHLSTITTYEDMWDFTIANYHSGNNCIGTGIKTLIENNSAVTFENYCALATSCPTACVYVERVKNYAAQGILEEE